MTYDAITTTSVSQCLYEAVPGPAEGAEAVLGPEPPLPLVHIATARQCVHGRVRATQRNQAACTHGCIPMAAVQSSGKERR